MKALIRDLGGNGGGCHRSLSWHHLKSPRVAQARLTLASETCHLHGAVPEQHDEVREKVSVEVHVFRTEHTDLRSPMHQAIGLLG